MSGLIVLTDPTMAGTRNSARAIAKRKDRIQCLRLEIATREDQIRIMEHEITILESCKFASLQAEGGTRSLHVEQESDIPPPKNSDFDLSCVTQHNTTLRDLSGRKEGREDKNLDVKSGGA